jgi:hypothetical protein
MQKCGESLLFLAPLFRAFAAFPPQKHPKISKNRNRVFPPPHDKNLYNFCIQTFGYTLLYFLCF